MSEAYWLVMPAAGSGRRFGSRKQHALLGGRTVLETALRLFISDSRCRGGSLVLAADDSIGGQLSARIPPRFALVAGGADRAASVYNGLVALESCLEGQDWVLVHDAARPCLSARDLDRLLAQRSSEAVGALLAVPVTDTVKQAEARASVPSELAAGSESGSAVLGAPMSPEASEPVRTSTTLLREALWLAQTPQMFRYRALRDALERAAAAARVPTDEAQAMEWAGFSVRLVPARDSNLKLTSAADLALAAAILQARGEAPCE